MDNTYCSKCGEVIAPGVRFCSACGTPVAGRPAAAVTPKPTKSTWNRDGLIMAGLAVVVVSGYFILREKPEPPRAERSAAMPGHEDMQAALLENMPTEYEPLIQMGNQFMDDENYPVAAEAYRRALELDPASPDVRSDFASCLHAMGLPHRALEEFRKVISTHPGHVISYFNLGIVFHGQGDTDSARYYWEKYLATDPQGRATDAARSFLKELGP
ncbi:MAG: tetratricopeptide repeat protein [Candidatus Zixiibacteriota bacterium]